MRRLAFAVYVDKRQLASYAFVAFVIGSMLGGAMWNFGGIYTTKPPTSTLMASGSLKRFASYDELKSFLRTRTTDVIELYGDAFAVRGFSFAVKSSADAASVQAEITGSPDFSGTNIQVEGVDEADVVKTDGHYIYLARDDTILIVKAYPPEDAEVVSRLHLHRRIGDLFVSGDKLVVFLAMSRDVFRDVVGYEPPPRLKTMTTIRVYDVSDRVSPVLEREVTLEGVYFNSRMIGDYVYAIVKKHAYVFEEEVVLPIIRSGRLWWRVKAEDIYYVNYSDTRFYFTHILAINTQDPDEAVSEETFLLGRASNLYVSPGNIYITAGSWEGRTTIHKIKIEDGMITYVADGTVPGWVLNQFSMDEHEGYFRIATTKGHVSRGDRSSSNNVYILNASLDIVGRLEDLAPGEKIYSARFMGNRCYLVTFKKVDPLFVINLADPESPRVLGKLKIPGYSDYLHPYDEDHLIGVGKETVEAEEGDFAWYQGVKISLFDVSDLSKPRELAKFEIGDRGTDSPVLRDHKAFLFSPSRNLLVIPVLVAEINPNVYAGKVPSNAHGEYVYQGAYIFDISTTNGIQLRGRVTHLDGVDDLLKSGFYFESEYSVKRALYIGDVLYTISDGMIKMNSLVDLDGIKFVELF